MGTPVYEGSEPDYLERKDNSQFSEDQALPVDGSVEQDHNRIYLQISDDSQLYPRSLLSPSQTREQEHRLDDDLAMLQVERIVSTNQNATQQSTSLARSRTHRSDPIDEFDVNTNPVHEKNAVYR